jgi:hypothetical protein
MGKIFHEVRGGPAVRSSPGHGIPCSPPQGTCLDRTGRRHTLPRLPAFVDALHHQPIHWLVPSLAASAPARVLMFGSAGIWDEEGNEAQYMPPDAAPSYYRFNMPEDEMLVGRRCRLCMRYWLFLQSLGRCGGVLGQDGKLAVHAVESLQNMSTAVAPGGNFFMAVGFHRPHGTRWPQLWGVGVDECRCCVAQCLGTHQAASLTCTPTKRQT